MFFFKNKVWYFDFFFVSGMFFLENGYVFGEWVCFLENGYVFW